MSRSYRKHVYAIIGFGKYARHFASKRLRYIKPVDHIIGKSCLYKRFYPQYDIVDYRWYCPVDDELYNKYKRK